MFSWQKSNLFWENTANFTSVKYIMYLYYKKIIVRLSLGFMKFVPESI